MRHRGSWAIAAVVGFSAVACSGNFDSTRAARPFADRATLGQEIFGALCDRVGASALAEDLSGDSYHAVCHPDDQGGYADQVDPSLLPPVSGSAALHRRLAVAKLEALARHRTDLIRSFDVVFPDIEIEDPHARVGTPDKVRLHDAVRVLMKRLSPLYDSNPLAPADQTAQPLIPAGTQAVARALDALAESPQAQASLARFGGRKGYRPSEIALGVLKPVLSYPDLRGFVRQSVRVLAPIGPARLEFEQLLRATQEELLDARPSVMPAPLVVTDPFGIAQPNRPRDAVEIAQLMLLSSDPAFAFPNAAPAPIVQRDARGFAVVNGSRLGEPGTVPAPFSDLFHDGPSGPEPGADGMADVDAYGRFIDGEGNPVAVDLPFDAPGTVRVREGDSLGRALLADGRPAFEYFDTQQTMAASLARDVRALADPVEANDHETLLNTLAGAYLLLGDRVDGAKATYEGGRELSYRKFDASTSPLVDLAWAAGQVLSDPESDDYLQMALDLLQNHEQDVARLVGVGLELKRIADEHAEAGIPATSTLWDELAEDFARIVEVGPADGDPNGRSLLEDLLVALADDRSLLLAGAYSNFFKYRDRVSYDPDDINGFTLNLESNDGQQPHVPVDRSSPDSAFNRSAFQRSLQIIYDTTGTTACNKKGATVHLVAGVLGLTVPADYPSDALFNVLCPSSKQSVVEECSVYEVNNLAHFYVQAQLETDPNPPADFVNRHKATLVVKDACLQSLGNLTDMDATFEASSGIKGLTTHPTHTAMSRLVFFGSDSWNLPMPDLDPSRNGTNSQLNLFLADLQDPIGSPLCPKSPSSGLNKCLNAEDTLRVRDAATIFLWEHFDFNQAMRPLLRAFYDHDREDLFTDLVATLHRHMASKQHGPECEKKGTWRRDAPDFNAKYCAESGVVSYEPMLARQLVTDLIPAAHRISKVLLDQRVESHRYRKGNHWPVTERRGSEIAASMVRALFSTDYASKRQLTDRSGNKSTYWSDGVTVKAQTTPFDLAANALDGMDARFESAKGFTPEERADRRARWLKARSQLVDQFLAVEGMGTSAKFRNPAVAKVLLRAVSALREQLNAQCPTREVGGGCTWARFELASKTAELIEDPLFAAIADLLDKLRADHAHAQIEYVLQYLLDFVDDSEEMRAVLATSTDLVQMLRDGQTLPPVLNVLAQLAAPEGDAKPGQVSPAAAADIALQILQVMTLEPDETADPDHETEFDRYHVVERLLANLVKPIEEGKPSKTPLEVFVDAAADVNRIDSSDEGPLSADDYGNIARSLSDLLTDPSRGMEQFYTVVRGRTGD